MIVGGRRLGVAVIAVAVSSGCSGAKPTPLPTRVASPSASTPAPVASTSPAAPSGPYPLTKEGAYAIVRDFYAKKNDAIVRRDSTAYDALTTKTCKCRELDTYVSSLRYYHQHIDGELISNVVPFSFEGSGVAAQVTNRHDYAAGKRVTNTGVVKETDVGGHGAIDIVELMASSGQWLVSAVRQLSLGSTA